jgi:hypothetical protein
MAVYKANLNRLRTQMKARSKKMSEAIRDAQARIRKGANVAVVLRTSESELGAR